MNPTPAIPSNPPAVTLFGGEQITVELRATKPIEAQKVTVLVREMKPSEMGSYLAAVHSMTDLVELVTDQPKGWADTVVPADLFKLARKAKELNDPFFVEWLEIQGPELRRLGVAMGRQV